MDQQMENATLPSPWLWSLAECQLIPQCLNLTQKYLIIYMVPLLSFVSSTLEEAPDW